LSRNDVRVILLSQLLVELSPGRDAAEIARHLDVVLPETKDAVERIWTSQEIFEEHAEDGAESPQAQQLTLFK
jgi:hypothetical protein